MEPFRITLEMKTTDAMADIQRACAQEGEKLPKGTRYPFPMLTIDCDGTARVEWFYRLAGISGGGGD